MTLKDLQLIEDIPLQTLLDKCQEEVLDNTIGYSRTRDLIRKIKRIELIIFYRAHDREIPGEEPEG